MSENEKKFFCGKCREPAKNESMFRNSDPPYEETMDCPKCGSPEIVSERISKFRKSWKIIIESGLQGQVQSINGAYLKLGEKSDEQNESSNINWDNIPTDVAERLKTKMTELQQVVLESGILEKLEKDGVCVNLHVTD